MAYESHSAPAAPTLERGFSLGPWQVHPELNLLIRGAERHRIHGKFMAVLQCLAAGDGLVNRQQLFDEVWPDTVVVEECLTRSISELRKVLGDDPRRPRYIETVPKKGYRLLMSPAPITGACPATAAVESSPAKSALGVGQLLWAAAVAVPAVLVLALVLGATEPPPQLAPELHPLTSLPGRERFPALTSGGDLLAFVWDGGDNSERTAVYVQPVAGGEPRRLVDRDGRYAYPAWSHDARRVAYVRAQGARTDIFSHPVDGAGDEWLLVSGEDGRVPLMPDFSPDGRLLAYAAATSVGEPHAIYLMDLVSARTRRLSEPGGAPAEDLRPRFSADGTRVAYLQSRSTGFSVAVSRIDGSHRRVIELGEHEVIDLVWDPRDPESLLFSAADGLWRLSTRGGPPQLVSAGKGHVGALAAAPAAGLLTWVDAVENRDIWKERIGDGEGRTEARRIVASSGRNARPAFSHDGDRIAFVSDRGGEPQLWLSNSDGSSPRRLADAVLLRSSSPAWSPDDGRIAFVAQDEGQAKVCVVDLAGGRLTTLTEKGAHELAPSWSADGGALYVSRQQTGGWAVIRRPVTGGATQEISAGPGFGAIEWPAGEAVVYARVVDGKAELWHHPLRGGEERLITTVSTDSVVSWSLRAGCLYTCSRALGTTDRYVITRRALDSDATEVVAQITSRSVPSFDISVDETQLLFDRADYAESDLVGALWPT